MDKVNVFISYAHKDKEGLKDFLNYINESSVSNVTIWYDENISVGQEWDEIIKENLNKADIVVLLLSQLFLNSTYIKENELETALQRHDNKEATVIPIFYRYCRSELYPSRISAIQGFPNPEEPLFEADKKKDRYYAELQKKIENLANQIITTRAVKEVGRQENNALFQQAKTIEHLQNSNKIFLSIPSLENLPRRKNFLNDIIRKVKFETPDWPYQIVPSTQEVSEFLQADEDEQQKMMVSWIEGCIYDIHLMGNASDLKSKYFVRQYDLAKKNQIQAPQDHTILWFLDPAVKENLSLVDETFSLELKMLPAVLGNDVNAIFQQIDSFDKAKQKMITTLSVPFSPLKKVFMFYNGQKDYNNNLRIKLRKKIQETKDYAIRDPAYSENENIETLRKEFEECQGAIIFYGPESDGFWYKDKEKIIRKAGNIKAGAVCIDGKEEDEIETKVDRDVSVNEILPIKGLPELEKGVTMFKTKLQENFK